MVCKFCGAFLSDDLKDCPVCGALLDGDSSDVLTDTDKNETNPQNASFISPDSDELYSSHKNKKNKKMVILTVILSVLLVLAIAVCVLLSIDGVSAKIKGFFTDVFSSSQPKENNNPKEVVAEYKGEQLTNELLNYYYHEVYMTLYSMYGDQMEAFITTYALNEGETLEDFFIEMAINDWENNVTLTELAQKENFILDSNTQAQVDSISQALTETALSYGFDNADAYIKYFYGDFASSGGYCEYYKDITYTDMFKMEFFNEKYHEYLDDIDGLETLNYSVRHILFQPTDKEDTAAWTEAENKANEIYQAWLSGDATEESFGELAKEHSSDGSAIYGGLYEDIPEGYMVDEFNDWCFADGRKTGDHGIVKTEFGYHIMYFVAYVNPDAYDTANSDLSAWISTAKGSTKATTYPEKMTIKKAAQ